MCAGCGVPVIVRQALKVSEHPIVVANATGCLEVASTIYPYTSWSIPWIHSAFENAAATISGVESMYKVLRKRGKLDKKIKFLAFGGDGGTYDIGIQALSGAIERGHDFLYICYNNEAYMNTGIQRSSATPKASSTTTSPVGDVIVGKREYQKDLTRIIAAHKIYTAQASPSEISDFTSKVKKGIDVDGPAFINIIAPCPRGWRSPTEMSIRLARLSVKTCFWPLYEVEDEDFKLTSLSKNIAEGRREKLPLIEYIKYQGRFKHLLSEKNKKLLSEISERVDREWEKLMSICGY
ncbi:MAG: thiamine pyrophosphate-dependent enzyme [Candidatus Methanofastidiosia archaeon]